MSTIILEIADDVGPKSKKYLYGDANIITSRTLSMTKSTMVLKGMADFPAPYCSYYAILAYLILFRKQYDNVCSVHYSGVENFPLDAISDDTTHRVHKAVKTALVCQTIIDKLFKLPDYQHISMLAKIFLTRMYNDIRHDIISEQTFKLYRSIAHDNIVAYIPPAYFPPRINKLLGIKRYVEIEKSVEEHKNFVGRAIKIAAQTLLKLGMS